MVPQKKWGSSFWQAHFLTVLKNNFLFFLNVILFLGCYVDLMHIWGTPSETFLHLEIYFFVSCSFCRIFAISWTDLCESTLEIYWFITLEIVIWLSAFLECLWENAMQLFRIVLHNTNRKSGSQNILVLSASKNPQMKVKIKHTVLQSEITIAWSSCFDCHVESHIISKIFESVLIWITL